MLISCNELYRFVLYLQALISEFDCHHKSFMSLALCLIPRNPSLGVVNGVMVNPRLAKTSS